MKRRNTPSKEAILSILINTGKAMSSDSIGEKLDINVDRATVYRILNSFCEDGITHKIIAEDGKQYFALSLKSNEKKIFNNHFHFRCTNCDTIECLTEIINFSAPKGYSVEKANCVLTGVCAQCATTNI